MPRKKKEDPIYCLTSKATVVFNELIPKAAKLHTKTFCMKKGEVKKTEELTGEECLNCKMFVANGGLCDPL